MVGIARSTIFAALLALSSTPALAQSGDAILILDASGSMWGQVDGQTKISAARKAVGALVARHLLHAAAVPAGLCRQTVCAGGA